MEKPPVVKNDYGKIVGGSRVQKGAYLWLVMFWDYNSRDVVCGGALLNKRVLTAASCFFNGSSLDEKRRSQIREKP